jgi:outer membrane protein TolC
MGNLPGRKYAVLLGICLIVPFLSAFSQKLYSLQELSDSASRYYPQLAQKQALLGGAQASVTETKNLFLPLLRVNDQINLSTDNTLPGSYLPYGIVPSTSSGVRSANDGTAASGNIAILYGQYDLVDFGYRRSAIQTARSTVEVYQADLNREIYQVKIQAATLYFNLLKTQFRLGVDQQNISRYENIYHIIRALASAGIKPGADSSLAMAELSKSRIQYNQTLGQVSNLKQQISFFTGIAWEKLRIDTATNTYTRAKTQLSAVPGDTAVNPLLEYYITQKNLFLATEHQISKSYLPKIALTATGWIRGSSITFDDQYKDLSYGLGYQRYNYLAGISFQYDLFNGIHKRDRLRVFQNQTTASEWAIRQEELVLHSAYVQAETDMKTTEDNLMEIPVQLAAAEDTYNQKLAQYKAGLINLIDLTNAAFVLDRSQNDYLETLGNWFLAELNKATVTGSLEDFIKKIK